VGGRAGSQVRQVRSVLFDMSRGIEVSVYGAFLKLHRELCWLHGVGTYLDGIAARVSLSCSGRSDIAYSIRTDI